ncbi:MAG: DUF2007 domain-containing protein [Verrucomicrobia bacterium]|nr:DUF2007 domain-containing protein [Verrucomicrobiota bacterium]
MKKVFESCEHEKVGLFQSILESSGISSLIKNDCISAAEGTSPLDLVLPELWVMNDLDYQRAIDILTPYYQSS